MRETERQGRQPERRSCDEGSQGLVGERCEGATLQAVKMKGPQAKKCRRLMEVGKGEDLDSPLEPPEALSTHLDF